MDSIGVNMRKKYKLGKLRQLIVENVDLAPQGSQEWLDIRQFNIGGSEMATITGDGGFSTIPQLVARKAGLGSFNGNTATRWGKLFEEVTNNLTKRLFFISDDNGIFETGSLAGCVPNQRYSPDGLALVRLKCAPRLSDDESIDDKYEYFTVLFEYKSPMSSIPNGKIAKYYLPQVKTGLNSIEIADFALFVNNMFRKCSLNDFNFSPAYNRIFHNGDVKKKYIAENPIAMGIILFYQTKKQMKQIGAYSRAKMKALDKKLEKLKQIKQSNSCDSDSDNVDDSADIFSKIGNECYSDCDSDGLDDFIPDNIEDKICDNAIRFVRSRRVKYSDSVIDDADLIDFGGMCGYDFDDMLRLYEQGLLSVEIIDPCVFKSECHRIPIIHEQNNIEDMSSIEEQKNNLELFKNKGTLDYFPVGFLPWKMLKSDIIYQERVDNYVQDNSEKIQDFINIVKGVVVTSDKDEIMDRFDKLYPTNKITASIRGDSPEYIRSMLPQNI
jgi:hypothetical protein